MVVLDFLSVHTKRVVKKSIKKRGSLTSYYHAYYFQLILLDWQGTFVVCISVLFVSFQYDARDFITPITFSGLIVQFTISQTI